MHEFRVEALHKVVSVVPGRKVYHAGSMGLELLGKALTNGSHLLLGALLLEAHKSGYRGIPQGCGHHSIEEKNPQP